LRNFLLYFLLSSVALLFTQVLSAQASGNEAHSTKLNQSQLQAIAQTLQVQYQVLSNVSQRACATTINNGQCFTARLSYQNGATAIPANVHIYFSHIAPIVSVDSKQVTIEHVNGDLHKLSFVEGLAANARLSVEIMAPFWHASRSDVMPNHYLAIDSLASAVEGAATHSTTTAAQELALQPEPTLNPEIVASTKRIRDANTGIEYAAHAGNWQQEQQYRRRADDNLPLENPQQLFAHYPDWSELAANWKSHPNNNNHKGETNELIERDPESDPGQKARPIPNVSSRKDSSERLKLTSVQLKFNADEPALNAAIQVLNEAGIAVVSTVGKTDVESSVEGMSQSAEDVLVAISLDKTIVNPDAYRLNITNKQIHIQAGTRQGAVYALLTLSQLYHPTTQSLPVTQINDAPRFGFRGLHLDVARHFPGKQAIETVLAQMFRLKLNKLHLHLSDDEGWRLAIPSLPELTEIGGFRCHDLQENRCLLPQLGSGPHKTATGNGFLTVADYQDLLTQAQRYGIEVIPSFDMPGHARAAVKAMQARYRRLMAAGKPQQAKAFLLADPQDTTDYLSIQFYRDNTINPCMDSSYHFIETVLRDIHTMHQQVGVPLQTYHLGADETAGAWKQSPICAAKHMEAEQLLPYFVARVVDIGNSLGLVMAGWSDGMEESLESLERIREATPGGSHKIHKEPKNQSGARTSINTQVNIWDTLYWGAADKVEEFSRHGVPVVLSLPDVLYFDFPYRSHPLEPGYYWGSRSVSTRKVFQFMPEQLRRMADVWPDRFGNPYGDVAKVSDILDGSPQPNSHSAPAIRGLQAQLWTEVTSTQQAVEYMLFPRLFAFAERAWHYPPWQKPEEQEPDSQEPQLDSSELAQQRLTDWHSFAYSLANSHIPRVVKQGINVRIAPPGAQFKNGQLHMKSALPGLALQYSNDGINWLPYHTPVAVEQPVWVRSQLPETGRFSAVDKVE